jgi:PAS domain S-box-containing protein
VIDPPPADVALDSYWRIFQASPVGIAINALDGRFIDVNASALQLFGLRREDVIGRTSTELGLLEREDARPTELAIRVRERGTMRNEERTIRSSTGQKYDVLLLVDVIEIRGEPFFVSTFLDVTEHKRSIDRLVLSETRYRQIVETAREGICIADAEAHFTFVNSQMARMVGYRPEEMLGMSIFAVIDAQDMAQLEGLLERRRLGIAEGGDFRVKHRDGHHLWVKFESSPILDAAGHYAGVLSVVLDITERVLAEQRLRRSEALLDEAQALAHIGSWEWDLGVDNVTRSKELCRIFGLSPEAFGTSPSSSYELVHPDDRERLRSAIEQATRELRSWEIEYRIVRRDGVRILLARGQVISDEEGKPVRMVGTAQDVTERREIESRAVLNDRMASVGLLAAGVAHEINNPLTYVIGNLDLVAEALRACPPGSLPENGGGVQEMIREAREGAERVKSIVGDLKTFSRAEEDRRVSLDPRRVLDLAANIASAQIRYRARLVKDYGAVPDVSADEARLGQVFVNLLINAAQAIPGGQVDRHEIRMSTRTNAAGRVVMEVRDTGGGIPADVLGHIFDPFYTTKPVGSGTGLGLSVCHGIVTELGGEISAESEIGKGALFRVVLPPCRMHSVLDPVAPTSYQTDVERRPVLAIDDAPLTGAVIVGR